MEKHVFIKNIPFSEPQKLVELVEYEEGRVGSRTFAQNPSLSLTLFAFDKGEGVSTHTAPEMRWFRCLMRGNGKY